MKTKYIDQELCSTIETMKDAADNEAFEGVMHQLQELQRLLGEPSSFRNRLSLVNRMMEFASSVYVQGMPGWSRAMVVRMTSIIFQFAMAEYLSMSKDDAKLEVDESLKGEWMDMLPKIQDPKNIDIVFETDMVKQGLKLLQEKEADTTDDDVDENIAMAMQIVSCVTSFSIDSDFL